MQQLTSISSPYPPHKKKNINKQSFLILELTRLEQHLETKYSYILLGNKSRPHTDQADWTR